MSELAEGARLEIVYAPQGYLGFESPSLRQNKQACFGALFNRIGRKPNALPKGRFGSRKPGPTPTEGW